MTRNDNHDLSRSNPKTHLKATSSDFAAQKVISHDSRAKSQAPARRIYENYYRHYRTYGIEPMRPRTRLARQCRDCAKRSWLDVHEGFCGWMNDERWLKFVGAMANNRHSVWEIPF